MSCLLWIIADIKCADHVRPLFGRVKTLVDVGEDGRRFPVWMIVPALEIAWRSIATRTQELLRSVFRHDWVSLILDPY
jgi:hypothetical protein